MEKITSNIPDWLISLATHDSLAVREIAHEVSSIIARIPDAKKKELELWIDKEICDWDFSIPQSSKDISDSRALNATPASVLELLVTRVEGAKYNAINPPQILAVGAAYFLGLAVRELEHIENVECPRVIRDPGEARLFEDWAHAIFIVSEILGAQKSAASQANEIANQQRTRTFKNPKKKRRNQLQWKFVRLQERSSEDETIEKAAEKFFYSLDTADKELYANLDSAIVSFMRGLRQFKKGQLYSAPDD